MPRLLPLAPPHRPEKVSVIWMNNSFREKVNNLVYQIARKRYPQTWAREDPSREPFTQLSSWGKHYIEWRSGKRVAPAQLTKKTLITLDDRLAVEEAIDQAFQEHVSQLRAALREIDSVSEAQAASPLSELLSEEA